MEYFASKKHLERLKFEYAVFLILLLLFISLSIFLWRVSSSHPKINEGAFFISMLSLIPVWLVLSKYRDLRVHRNNSFRINGDRIHSDNGGVVRTLKISDIRKTVIVRKKGNAVLIILFLEPPKHILLKNYDDMEKLAEGIQDLVPVETKEGGSLTSILDDGFKDLRAFNDGG